MLQYFITKKPAALFSFDIMQLIFCQMPRHLAKQMLKITLNLQTNSSNKAFQFFSIYYTLNRASKQHDGCFCSAL